mmetsp:Transcript_53866/g.123987  ORF Transcript_53866/g.123987 Transcript_53866/m.123987 type:complete len:201 (-) Transcript_53866:205-807(-)
MRLRRLRWGLWQLRRREWRLRRRVRRRGKQRRRRVGWWPRWERLWRGPWLWEGWKWRHGRLWRWPWRRLWHEQWAWRPRRWRQRWRRPRLRRRQRVVVVQASAVRLGCVELRAPTVTCESQVAPTRQSCVPSSRGKSLQHGRPVSADYARGSISGMGLVKMCMASSLRDPAWTQRAWPSVAVCHNVQQVHSSLSLLQLMP